MSTPGQNANEQGASHLLIMGYFNYGDINWKSGTTPSELTNPATAFRETLRDMYLYQHVNEPTHYRAQQHPNTLDLIITNEEGMVDNLSLSAPVERVTICAYISTSLAIQKHIYRAIQKHRPDMYPNSGFTRGTIQV